MRKQILIIKLGAFGDIIMAEGLMREIRTHHKADHITLLTEPFYARFLKPAPHFDNIITDTRPPVWQLHKFLAARKFLRAQNFDIIYDLQNSRRSHRYQKWIAAPKISSTNPHTQDRDKNKSTRDILAAQLEKSGVKINDTHPDLRWAAADTKTIEPLLKAAGLTDKFILLIAGSAARHPQKRWAHYARLAEMLNAADIPCATAPGPDELELSRTIPAPVLLDNGKPLSFPQMLALAPHLAFVVGNDTGPTHLMSCAGTKGLALFNKQGASPTRTGITEFYDVLCADDLQTLAPEQVFEKVKTAYSNSV